jgi:uncharacterized membrane protein YdbT with pleckstrin-like domain
MPFPQKNLNDDESLILDLHPHWWYYAPALLSTAFVCILGLTVLTNFDGWQQVTLGSISLASIVVAGGWLVVQVVKWRTTYFVLTSHRVIYREGVVARNGVEIPLERVNNVNFNQTIFERFIGVGDILIESGGKDGQQKFSDIARPMAVQNEIHQALQGYREGTFRAAPSRFDVADQLERLEALRERGALTDAEFEMQKRRLLG